MRAFELSLPLPSPREETQPVADPYGRHEDSNEAPGVKCNVGFRAARRSVLPLLGEGWGEGEETLRKPARLRPAEEVDHPERRKSRLHARQCAESLAVASRLPPHLAPPSGRGNAASR